MMKTKLLIFLIAWLLLPVAVWSQCGGDPVNANGVMNGTAGTAAYIDSPSYLYPFLDMSCQPGSGPTVANWFNAAGTPDANPDAVQPYVAAQTSVNVNWIGNEVYESFYTTAMLAPNTSYSMSFRIAVKNATGTNRSVLQIVNQPGAGNGISGGNTNCDGNSSLPAILGQVLYTEAYLATGTNAVEPVFQDVCASFTTNANVNPTIASRIWFRFSFDVASTSAIQRNLNYISNFQIVPCTTNPLVASIGSTCTSGVRTLTASTAPAITGPTYQWFRDNIFIAGATNATFSPTQSGVYTVVVRNPAGCRAIANFTVPGVTVTSTCIGGNRTLTATLGGSATGVTFQWQLNNINIAGATQATYIPTANGTYRVLVQGGTDYCSAIPSLPITVSIPTVSISQPCVSGVRNLVISPVIAGTRQWLLDGVAIIGATGANYIPTQNGTYTLRVTDGGCVYNSTSIIVNNVPTLLSDCIAGKRTLTATAIPAIANATYRWYLNNVLITGANNATYIPTTNGTYYAEIVNPLTNCGFRTSTMLLSMPTASIQQSCVSGSKLLTAIISPAPTSPTYQWYVDGSIIPGATNSTYMPNGSGIYRVDFTSGTNGCVYTSTALNLQLLKVTLNTPTLSVLCSGQSAVSLVATVSGGTTPYTYSWSGPAGTPNTNSSTISVSNVGTYSVTVTDGSNCSKTTTTQITNSLDVVCPEPVCPGGIPTLRLTSGNTILGNYVAGWYKSTDLSPNPELHSVIKEEGDYFAVVVSEVCTLKTVTPCHISFLAHPDPIVLSQTGSGFGCNNTVTNITVTNPGVNDANGDGNYFNDNVTYQWNTGEVNNLSNRTVTGFGSWSISAQNNTTGCVATSNSVGVGGPSLSINRTCVGGQIILTAGANFATGIYHWFLYNSSGVPVEITNPAQLSNGGASLTVLTPGIYMVTNTGSDPICPGVKAEIYENMVTTSPNHISLVSNTDGQFENLVNCASAKNFTSELGCIDRSAYIIENPNYINPTLYGVSLPGNYMINQSGLNAGSWNYDAGSGTPYWQGLGFNNSDAFMIVDGQPALSEKVVWSLPNVPVTSGYNYLFKAMVRNITANTSTKGEEIPTLYLRVKFNNGGSYSERRQILYGNSAWVELTALAPALGLISSGTTVNNPTSATIEIVVDGGNIVGRDLAIDNITFQPYGLCDVLLSDCGSSAKIAVSEKTVCAGSPVTFNVNDASTDASIQYNWTEKNVPGIIMNSKDFTITPLATTEYILTVVNPTMQCSFTKSVKATVIVPTIVVNAGPDKITCQGQAVQLNGSGAVTYDWGNIASISNRYIGTPFANPMSTETYTVIGRDANGCESTDQVKVIVNPAPMINAGPNVAICQTGAASLHAVNAVSYVWSPAAGLSSTTTADPVARPATTTTYSVVGTSALGCQGSTTVTVTVNPVSCTVPIFDGVDDQVTIPASSAYNLTGANNFTFEAWVQLPSGQNGVPTIISRRTEVTPGTFDGFLWGFYYNSQMVLQTGNTNHFSPVFTNLYDNNCHHIAVRRAAGIVTFFIDGVAIGNAATTSTQNISSNSVVRIGNDIVSTTPLKGAIQEVRFWTSARTNTEIATNQATIFGPSTPFLLGYWRFRQAGQIMPDESATRNDGVLGLVSTDNVRDPQMNGTACAELRQPENPTSTTAGVFYKYYEGEWNNLPNFTSLTPVKNGTWPNVSPGMQNRGDRFGVTYSGYINVAVDGYYTFYTSSDDGSRMYIGNTLVVDNDGLHAMQERSGVIGLKAGKHIFKVTFFEKDGGENVELRYQGPGIAKQIVPNAAYSYNSSNLRQGVLDLDETNSVSFYPNPVIESVKVLVRDSENLIGVATIRLVNQYGIEVYNNTASVNQETDLNLELPSGIYVAIVTLTNGTTYQSRIVIQK